MILTGKRSALKDRAMNCRRVDVEIKEENILESVWKFQRHCIEKHSHLRLVKEFHKIYYNDNPITYCKYTRTQKHK